MQCKSMRLIDLETHTLTAIKGMTGLYARMLTRLIRHPLKVLATAVALLVGVQVYYAVNGNGVEFFPDVEPEQALVYIHARGNFSAQEKERILEQGEKSIRGSIKEMGILKRAESRARMFLRSWLKLAGFSTVTFSKVEL